MKIITHPSPGDDWEQKRQARIGRDCADGKHLACIGDAWDTEADTPADCECDCHEEGTDG